MGRCEPPPKVVCPSRYKSFCKRLICPLYHPSVGGNQKHIQLLSEKIAALGDEVSVFTCRSRFEHFGVEEPNHDPLPEKELLKGVRVQRFDVDSTRPSLLAFAGKMRGGYRLLKLVLGDELEFLSHGPFTRGMFKAIGALAPDVMMASNNFAFTSYIAARAKSKWGIPFVFMPITHVGNPWARHPALRRVLEAADLIAACTEFERNFLVQQGVPRARIKTLPMGADLASYKGADPGRVRSRYGLAQHPVVGYIGRKAEGKGVDTLIESMPLVWQKFPEARLLLAGRTSDHCPSLVSNHLAAYTSEQRRRTIQIENYTEEEKKDLFAAADLVAMTSLNDAFGWMYLDAWAARKPVIACRGTPQESIIDDGRNGLLVEYGQKADLAEAVTILLSNPSLRHQMGEDGRRKLEREFDMDVSARNMRRAYAELISRA